MTQPVDIGDVVAGLTARVQALVAELLPNGVREGHEWRVGSPAGEKGRSMAVHLTGAKAGVWKDFASGTGGDALDLVAACLFGGDKRQAFAWARGWLGFGDVPEHDAARRAQLRAQAEARKEREVADEKKTRAGIKRLWLGCAEKLRGTPVDLYLQGRGIELSRLQRQPRSLRFHASLRQPEAGASFPALVAGCVSAAGEMVAVHRTWLARDGASGAWVKAPVRDPKMTWGRLGGASIRLWRGASNRALKDAPKGEAVVITEGIEDGLTVALAAPELRVLVGVSLANMGQMKLPEQIGRVVIHAHNDEAPAAIAGLERAVANFRAQGFDVALARAPGGAKDFNDVVKANAKGVA